MLYTTKILLNETIAFVLSLSLIFLSVSKAYAVEEENFLTEQNVTGEENILSNEIPPTEIELEGAMLPIEPTETDEGEVLSNETIPPQTESEEVTLPLEQGVEDFTLPIEEAKVIEPVDTVPESETAPEEMGPITDLEEGVLEPIFKRTKIEPVPPPMPSELADRPRIPDAPPKRHVAEIPRPSKSPDREIPVELGIPPVTHATSSTSGEVGETVFPTDLDASQSTTSEPITTDGQEIEDDETLATSTETEIESSTKVDLIITDEETDPTEERPTVITDEESPIINKPEEDLDDLNHTEES